LTTLPVAEPRIFVNIAAYRDTECQWTVKDLFEKAREPARLAVGLCWQFVPGDDDDCFLFRTRPEQVRTIELHAKDSRGVCWARHRTQTLWQGEDYTLQIDSHMRFVEHWDDRLLAMLASCPSDKAVLSSYPPTYVPPDQLGEPATSRMFAQNFDELGVLKLHSYSQNAKDAPPAPEKNPFCAAGFLFGPSDIIGEVPYDPHLYFQGEEITLAARLWTHGWDIYSPNGVILYHDYTKRPARPRHWHDHAAWTKANQQSCARVRHLLGMENAADPDALAEIERYGLGAARSLAEYQAFSGVDFARRLINGKSSEEIEASAPAEERRKRHVDTFTQIWSSNGWGNDETRSGAGSSIAATEAIRAELPELFDFLGIATLIDAGCGECNWISRISERLRLYLGYDLVPEMLEAARQKYGRRRGHFFAEADIVLDLLPQADAILCRDVLTHLPLLEAKEALGRFKQSGARYLIATSFERDRNDAVKTGGWQPMALGAPPFSLPPPRHLVSERRPGASKALGVWLLKDLP
jgi:hypothetical protein